MRIGQVAFRIEQAAVLMRAIFQLAGEDEGVAVEAVLVYKVKYGSPFEITLIIEGVQASIGALVGLTVGVNAAVQRLRRSWTNTGKIRSEHQRDQSRAEAESAIYEQIKGVVRGEVDADQLAQIANAAQYLNYIAVVEVPEPPELENPPSNP